MLALNSILLLAVATASVSAYPSIAIGQVLQLRASTTVNPDAVTGTKCIDTTA